jgi:hypothetical protein
MTIRMIPPTPTILLAMPILLAAPAMAAEHFPLESGASWTLTSPDDQSSWTYHLGGQHIWQDRLCQARTEFLDDQFLGTTYWSEDAAGRVLLHGLESPPGGAGTWLFDPAVVMLAPEDGLGEQTATTTHVYEVQEHGLEHQGQFTVRVQVVGTEPVTTPLGTFAAITVRTIWEGSPAAPWRYAADGEFSYAPQIGPVRIGAAGLHEPRWLLSALEGLTVASAGTSLRPLRLEAGPNPFNPTTTLRFSLPEAGPVRLQVVDLAGRRVAVLRDGPLAAGFHAVTWQPRALASGVYLARLEAGSRTATTRLLLVE